MVRYDHQVHTAIMPKSPAQIEARQALLKRGILPLIEQGESLEILLERLIENIEGQAEKMLAAVFFYDPATDELTVGSAPHLQPSYQKAVNGFKVAPSQPACGSAVFKRERVICIDVRTDPLWKDLREFAEGSGIRAVWSQPIFDHARAVIGTMAFYFPEPKDPDDADLAVLEIAASLASTIMQARKDQALAIIRARI